MEDKESAIRFLRRTAARKKGPVDKALFMEATSVLYEVAAGVGLEDNDIDVCISFIMQPFVSVTMKRSVFQCMFPVTIVSDSATKKVLCWIFSEYHKSPPTSIAIAMQWLSGLLEFGLTDPEMIDGFYPLLFFLLRVQKLTREACRLISLLTKSEDVKRWRVEEVLKIQKGQGPLKHVTALLSLFKAYRPEFVPEKVPAMSMATAFGKNSEKFLNGFEAAAKRKEASGVQDPWLVNVKWNIAEAGKAASLKGGKLIPPISYIHFESLQYRSNDALSVLEFKTIEEICSYQLTLDIPCNVMSLLHTPEGRHILAFADDSVQRRFSYSLYYTLYQVFLSPEKKAAVSEMKDLLQQIWELEQYMLQGIPVVSRFLAIYMNIWNGNDYFEEILQLLEWITYSSFQELYECILIHLKTYFRVLPIESQCSILRMLGKMLRNLLVVRLHRKDKKFTAAFIGAEDLEDRIEAGQGLSQFIGDLCTVGLLHTSYQSPGHALLLDEALNFYEMIVGIEAKSSLPLWTVLQPLISYRCFFSRNAVMISRICSLLLRYKMETVPQMKSLGYLGRFNDVQDMLNQYVGDLGNCLWTGKALLNADIGYIFKDLEISKLRNFLQFIAYDKSFSISTHIAFHPYVKQYVFRTVQDKTTFDRKEYLRAIGEEFPDISRLIKHYVERNFPTSPSDE